MPFGLPTVAQNGVWSRKGKLFAVVSGGEVGDYCTKKISNGFW